MKSNQTYTPEFKAEAVKLVLDQGLSQAEAAERLGVPKSSLANWVVDAKRQGRDRAQPAQAISEITEWIEIFDSPTRRFSQ